MTNYGVSDKKYTRRRMTLEARRAPREKKKRNALLSKKFARKVSVRFQPRVAILLDHR
jgi:hypothetical protein